MFRILLYNGFLLSSFYLYKCVDVEPVTDIIGGPELHINKGSTINLTCIVKYAPEPPPSVVWSHNRQVNIIYESLAYFQALII